MIDVDITYAAMLIVVYSALVMVIFRVSRVFTAHDQHLEELRQSIALFEHELQRLQEYEAQRQMEIEAIRIEITNLQGKIGEMEERIGPDKLRARPRIYLANDRRAGNDQEFLVRVSNDRLTAATRPPAYQRSWRTGRTYVLWASSLEAARNNAEGRFPQSAHYSIELVERSPHALGDRHASP